MLKQRIFKFVVRLALLAAIAGSAGMVADGLGVSVTPGAYACQNPSSSGGGC